MNRIARSGVFVLVVTLALAAGPVFAQNPPPEQPQPQPPAATTPVFQSEQDAQSTRQQLFMVLQEYPPTVRRVLQLDPALMDRPDYLAPYPRLLAFLQQHPEIRRNPSFFLGSPNGPDFDRRPSDALPEILAGTGFFIGIMTILALATALLRQLIEYRRWLRQSRVQTEVHTKILDRLQSNEDLLAYVQTPAGRHFLESTPIATNGELRSAGAPLESRGGAEHCREN